MKISSSYILFPNKHSKQDIKKSDDGTIHLTIDSARLRLEKLFDLKDKINVSSWYKHNYNFLIENCNIELKIQEVSDATYMTITSIGKTKSVIIKSLETFQNTIINSEIEKDYVLIFSYDAVSEYYCNRIYPKLNELERNLRKLLFNIYTLNFGINYYTSTVNEDLQKKGKKNIRASGGTQAKEIEVVKKFFYALDYGDIQLMLFTPQWTQLEEKNKNDFLNKNANLNELTDEELRNAFSDLTPKSDWDRFFKSKIPNDDIENMINYIRKNRNNVAHCKFLNKDDYEQSKTSIRKLNNELLMAITITETDDFLAKNKQNLSESFERIRNSIKEIVKKFEPITQFARKALPASLQALSERLRTITELSLKDNVLQEEMGIEDSLIGEDETDD